MSRLFFSYSHNDEELRDALEVHLSMLKRQGLIEAMHDRRIAAGEVLDDSINAFIESADVILCLVSPDFIASEYCYSREMTRALQRHAAGECQVIPVILRHCEWQQTPLANLRGTPRDNKPIRAWADADEALNDVAKDIRRALEARSGAFKPAPSPTPPAGPSSDNANVVTPPPRSTNLHIPREITDRDRDECAEAAFEFTAEFFANSLAELNARQSQVVGKFVRLDARRFVATAYKNGQKVSAITVFTGAGLSMGRGITFNNSDAGETNSSNGSFILDSKPDDLKFRPLFSGSKEEMDREAVAEAIWASFMAPLQR